MQVKLLLVLFLAVSLFVSMNEASKDRRKKTKQRERQDDDEADQEVGAKGFDDAGKPEDKKERESVLKKQEEKKESTSSSSSEEEEDKEKNNGTVIVRARRSTETATGVQIQPSKKPYNEDEGVVLPTDDYVYHEKDARRKRNTVEIVKSKELNDGVQMPLPQKPSATAQPKI